MKKLLLLILISGMVAITAHAAKLKNKDVIGNWKYNVETYDGNLTGILQFTETEKKLEGEVHDDMGSIYKLSRVSLEGEELIFELQPDMDVINVKVKLVDGKLAGTVSIQGSEFKITAEKQQVTSE